jgi:hypothetical protein
MKKSCERKTGGEKGGQMRRIVSNERSPEGGGLDVLGHPDSIGRVVCPPSGRPSVGG